MLGVCPAEIGLRRHGAIPVEGTVNAFETEADIGDTQRPKPKL